MLQLINKSKLKAPVWLVDAEYLIGKGHSCAVIASGVGVREQHACIVVSHQRVSVRNLVGDGMVLVNGSPVAGTVHLEHGDEMVVGDTLLYIQDPKALLSKRDEFDRGVWVLKPKTSALKGRYFPVHSDIIVGRAKDCDICLGVLRLSRRHAKLLIVDEQLIVEDLNSSNGTFVNGERVARVALKSGDEVRFDKLCFVVVAPT